MTGHRRTYAIYKTSTYGSIEQPHKDAYRNTELEIDETSDSDLCCHAWLIDIYDHQLADFMMFYAGKNGIILIPECYWHAESKGCHRPLLEIYDTIRGG